MKHAQALSIQAAGQRRFGHLAPGGRARAEEAPGPAERKAGEEDEDPTLPCRTCNGTGDVPGGDGGTDDCPTCEGDGEVEAEECARCEGDGVEPETDPDDGIDCTRCNGAGALYEDGTPGAKREARSFAAKVQASVSKIRPGAAALQRPAPPAKAPAQQAAKTSSRTASQAGSPQHFAATMQAVQRKLGR